MINRDQFLDGYVRHIGLPTSSQGHALVELVDFLNEPNGLTYSINCVAYFLATVKHECAGTWRPMKESGSLMYLHRRYWNLKTTRRQLGNLHKEDAVRFCKHGYLPIAGRRNFELLSKRLDVDFVGNPDLMLIPRHSFRIAEIIMVEGFLTGKKITEYITERKNDLFHARRVIDGLNQAGRIEKMARQFLKVLTN